MARMTPVVAVGVVATYVFHFVLFGVMATRIGLGQLFLDIASTVAGALITLHRTHFAWGLLLGGGWH